MDWTDIRMLGSIAAGVVVAMLMSTERSWREGLFIVSSGLFFAFFFTEPVLNWIGAHTLEHGWPFAVAGFLAMVGSRLARRCWQLIDTAQFPWGRR